jgi:hypothetical protein
MDVTARAIEQQRSDRAFKVSDLAAQSGLRNVEPISGSSEMQFFRHGQEIAQAANVDPGPWRATNEIVPIGHTLLVLTSMPDREPQGQ